jgi:hypothetical protein
MIIKLWMILGKCCDNIKRLHFPIPLKQPKMTDIIVEFRTILYCNYQLIIDNQAG